MSSADAPPALPPWIRRWWPLWAVLGAVLLLVLIVGLWFRAVYADTSIPPVGNAAVDAPTVILDAAGDELGQLDPATVGEEIDADDLPDHVVRAVLGAEDRSYFEHGGFSTRGVVRAAWANLRSGEVDQGASTITQQYVDLTTPGAGDTFSEKARELAAALRYEDELGKQEVLDRYLNVVPFGRDAIGIDAAAQVYYRVPAAELDVNQAATLAGMIAAPSAFDPEDNPEDAERRRNLVLGAMAEEGWLASDEAASVRSSPLPEVADEPLVQYGTEGYVVDAVRRELEEILPNENLTRGYVVETGIDARLQQLAQETVRAHVADAGHTGAAVTIDPASGAVRALVGGADVTEEAFNAAIQAERQPGSSFKPFTLAAFVEAGNAPDDSTFPAPAVLEVETDLETVEVHNFGDQGFGEISVREATVNSVNTAYMQMVEEVGPGAVVDVAGRLGIRSELPAVPSIALGTGTVTPLEMASAYATLAAEGVHRTPVVVASVRTSGGEVVHQAELEEREAVSPQVAGVVLDVLSDVVQSGTGTAAQIGYPVAGKTGTTNDGRDVWFVGTTAQLTTAVWLGNADNSPIGPNATGGGLEAPLWADYMAQAMEPLEPAELPTASQDGLTALDRTPEEPAPVEPAPSPEPVEPPPPPEDPPAEEQPPPAEEQPPPEEDTPAEEGTPAEEESPTDDEGGDADDGSGDGTDDGSTEDTSTESDDGSTDDGSTDDGSTDDGSTDDGSTDDGSTDDGSTDDGSTDDGSTDDGSTDDGSTDDTSTETDDGSTETSTETDG